MAQNIFARHKYWTGFGLVVVVVAAVVGIVVAIFVSGSSKDEEIIQGRSFSIDHELNTFMKDGEPFRYVAGSFHYFRALPGTWRRKLQTLRAGGLNAVDLYVQWALHNPKDGVYNWDGIANVEEVVKIAQEEGLYIILRPGPYICAEIDNGGLPYWLATKYPGIKLRTSDPDYLREITKWYSMLMPKFEKYLYGNNGSIIMVQIENEYGSFGACDVVYKNFLRDETLKYTHDNALLFTVDMPYDEDTLRCGSIENVFHTTDFGINGLTQIEQYFETLRKVQPTGPLVNSEFYTGWLTFWQDRNSRRSARDIADTLRNMLLMKANVNLYMFFGGTNFGFWSGANYGGINGFVTDITSYDYDAPMDEAGNPTEKYMILRDVIKEFMEVPDESTIPPRVPGIAPTAVNLKAVDTILSPNGRNILGTRPFISNKLWTFEDLDQFSGFVLYETELPKLTRDPSNLVVSDLRDRALVYIDDEFVGTLSRENYISTLPISASFGSKLSILVENQGRINYGITDDYKGILGSVRVQTFHPESSTYETLSNWTITGFPFDNHVHVESFARNINDGYQVNPDGNLYDGPVVFHGEFEISEFQELGDTWWDTDGWGRGFVYVNGFNLGRYWPLVGPQITIYVPAELLKRGKNEVHIVELQKAPANLKMNFVNGAIFINDDKP